jgi:hypothetical protein
MNYRRSRRGGRAYSQGYGSNSTTLNGLGFLLGIFVFTLFAMTIDFRLLLLIPVFLVLFLYMNSR